jgi:hypothetical protein
MVTLEKSRSIFWYVAVPTSVAVLSFVGFAVDETSKPWGPLLIIKKETRYAGRYELTAKSRPEDGPGSLETGDCYPKDFYDKARVGDMLVFGFCHERLERGGSIVAVRVGWFAVPFLLGGTAWFALCILFATKPTLIQRGLCRCSAAIGAIGSAFKGAFQKAGLVLRMEARLQRAASPDNAAHPSPSRHQVGRSAFRIGGLWNRSQRSRDLSGILLPLPLFMPEIFFRVYEPINESLTVEWLGCGCPSLNGSTRLFNANDLNAILWLVVFAAATAFWVRLFERALSQARPIPRAVCGGLGVAVILIWSMKCYAAGFWL